MTVNTARPAGSFVIIPAGSDSREVAVQRIDDRVWIAIGDTTTALTVAEARQLAAAITRAMVAE